MNPSGLLPHWSESIAAWAAGEPFVLAVYAFGSRVKGGYRLDSDLDIAVVVGGKDEGDRVANATCLMAGWQRAVQELVPVKLDMDVIWDEQEFVGPAVREHSLLIYRASPADT